jgi:hypothetical protein
MRRCFKWVAGLCLVLCALLVATEYETNSGNFCSEFGGCTLYAPVCGPGMDSLPCTNPTGIKRWPVWERYPRKY